METTVTVAAVNPPKPNGKRSSIKTTAGAFIGFYADRLALQAGRTYRLLVEESEWQGKRYLNAEKIIEEVQLPASSPAQLLGNGSASALAVGPDRYWLPCVSNTIAHAIQAGLITEPLQIKAWAAAAKEALLELDQPPKLAAKSGADDQPPF